MIKLHRSISFPPLTLSMAVAAAFASVSVFAEPMLQYSNLHNRPDVSLWSDNYVMFGVGAGTSSSFKTWEFGGWRDPLAVPGAKNAEMTPLMGFNWLSRSRDNDALYWHVYGKDLGAESYKLQIDGGEQGIWRISAAADRLMRSELDTAKFALQGLGTATLTPAANCTGADATALAANPACQNAFKVQQGRDFYRFGAEQIVNKNFSYAVNYREDVRDGTRALGFVMSNFQSIAAAYPINDKTQQLEVSVSYADSATQAQATYALSKYVNELTAFTVESPYNNSNHRMSLAPSNDAHQVQLSLGHNFSRDTRLMAKLSQSVAQQNEPFLPFSVFTTTSPGGSLDGKVIRRLADLTLTSRLVPESSAKLSYQFNQLESDVASNTYAYTGIDSSSGFMTGGTTRTRINVPLSSDEHKVLADIDYRFGSSVVRGAYEMARKNYEHGDRAYTDTSKVLLELRKPVFDDWLGSAGYTYTQRRGADYNKNLFADETYPNLNPRFTNNPAMRPYLFADFDEHRARASASWVAEEIWNFQVGTDVFSQDTTDPNCANLVAGSPAAGVAYTSAPVDICLGRTNLTGASVNLDAQWQPEENVTTFGFITSQLSQSDQRGRSFSGATGAFVTTGDWEGALKNTDHSVGLGIKWSPKAGLDVGGQLVVSEGKGSTDITPTTAAAIVDTEYRMRNLQVFSKWQYSRTTTIRMNYVYERVASKDWAYDGLGMAPASNILLTGQLSPDYVNHVIGVSVSFHTW